MRDRRNRGHGDKPVGAERYPSPAQRCAKTLRTASRTSREPLLGEACPAFTRPVRMPFSYCQNNVSRAGEFANCDVSRGLITADILRWPGGGDVECTKGMRKSGSA